MSYNGVESLPVFNDDRFIGDIHYRELQLFLGDQVGRENIYAHKLNFDLESVMILIRSEKKEQLQASIKALEDQPVRNPIVAQLVGVAMFLAVLTGFGFFCFNNTQPERVSLARQQFPDSGKLVLTLADGRKINITDAKDGLLATSRGVEIFKLAGNTLKYKVNTDLGAKAEYHQFSTPKGVPFQILLADGSRVWLNAMSSVKFPASFEGLKDRRLSLNGEGYFEIVKEQSRPFLVLTETQQIKVLGTHFNVNAYLDEGITKTTLLEGSVEIAPLTGSVAGPGVKIRPGQQAILSGDHHIEVKQVEAENTIAWKDGEFVFRNEPLKNIMRRLGRWYDIEVYYQNESVGRELYGGVVSKSQDITEVLKIMEQTGDLHFVLKGKKIIVTQ